MTATRALLVTCLVAFTMWSEWGSGDPVRERFDARTKYPSCGQVRERQGDEFSKSATSEIECLRRAIQAGKGAEFSLTYPPTEGALIRDHFRLKPDGKLELYSDGTDDEYSDQKWEYSKCISPEWLPEVDCD